MPIYHLSAKPISRCFGKSVFAAVAYRTGTKMYDGAIGAASYRSGEELQSEHTGKSYDYTKKKGVVYTEIMLPDNAPREFENRQALWNAVELSETRINSRTAREVEVGLQVEFDLRENIEVLHRYIKENFVDKGMIADFAIHDKGDGNPHAHILLTTREVSEAGFGKKNRDWDKVEYLKMWREQWAVVNNDKFKEKGLDIRIDHRSLEEQGLEREPTIHVGRSPERAKKNAEIIKRNEKYRPAAVVEYMQEIQEGYEILDKHLQGGAGKQREADKLDREIENIIGRKTELETKQAELEQAKIERTALKMRQLQEKKELDGRMAKLAYAIENERGYFKNKLKIEFEAADREIQLKKAQSAELRRELATEDIFTQYKSLFALEYQRQRLLAKIRPDGEEILNAVKQSRLDPITDDDFKKILPEITPFQAKIWLDMRERENIRTQSRSYERTR